jgi:regulator of RNase E activity RraA
VLVMNTPAQPARFALPSEEARLLSTAEISDALDALRLPGSAVGIRHVAGGKKLMGPAFTVRLIPISLDEPGTVGDFIDDVLPGAVIVLDNGGRVDCTVWGGIMSQVAAKRGIAGTVVYGACRDTAEAEEAKYPLYASSSFMRTGKDRVQVEAVNGPVSLGDVRVMPGDLIWGDADGIVVVPAPRADEVLAKALHAREREQRILEAALAGMPLRDARKQFGYHTLQRPTTDRG